MNGPGNLPPDTVALLAEAMESSREPEAIGWDEPVPLDRLGLPPAFPLKSLPDWLGSYVDALATSTATPPDLAGMLVLAVLGACAGGRVWLNVRPDWAEPLNLYVAAVLGSGETKSAVFDRVTTPLGDYEAELVEAARPALVEARTRLEVSEQAAAAAKKVAGSAKPADRRQAEAEAISQGYGKVLRQVSDLG